MADIKTIYAEKLELRSPIIAASSGLTNNAEKIKEFAEAGVGAVVLKSIFEEELENEAAYMTGDTDFPEAVEYLSHYVKSHALDKHLDLIKAVKDSSPDLPVIASINCFKSDTWVTYAQDLADAGADALELNVMRIETARSDAWGTAEEALVTLTREISSGNSGIPVILKLSKYYTNLLRLSRDLNIAGAKGLVFFNRSYFPDIDIDNEKLVAGPVFSSAQDFSDGLRYAALVHGAVPALSLCLSSGARTGADLVKGLLAGADAVQYCTALYKGGARVISEANEFLAHWMDKHGYRTTKEMRGKLSASRVDNATFYQRSQFMRHFSSFDDRPTETFGGNIHREQE